jgi:hypothetical protein
MGREAFYPDNRSAVMTEEIATLTAEINALIAEPAAPLARLEDTLTTGYARALALEAERVRLERRLGKAAAEGDGEQARTLALRVSNAEEHILRLRSLLSALRERAVAARV